MFDIIKHKLELLNYAWKELSLTRVQKQTTQCTCHLKYTK